MSKTFEIFSLIFVFLVVSLLFVFSIPEQSPTKSLIKFFATFSFFLLSLSLLLGPLAVLWPKYFLKLLDFRKTIGVAAFIVLFGHFFLTMQNYFGWSLTKAAAAPGVLWGIVSFFILSILAITSFAFFYKSLGEKIWKSIHYFNYLAFILAFYHFILKASGPKQIFNYNYLEFFLILLGLVVILLQLAGFITRLKRKGN
ncbi:MAG: ferric reductase-like transmembrane domain-containing protein [Candidatus Anstonellaceae archaeon]